MSKELVRTNLDQRIERWRNGAGLQPVAPGGSSPVVPHAPRHTEAVTTWAPPENLPQISAAAVLIQVPRTCAVEKKLWTALYRRQAGEKYLTYLRSNIAESWRLTMYAGPERWGTLPANLLLGVELCPHCGAYTRDGSVGSVFCEGGCWMFCCYGLTSPQGQFTCACGRKGQLENGGASGCGIR
jgi:hypothetical protein